MVKHDSQKEYVHLRTLSTHFMFLYEHFKNINFVLSLYVSINRGWCKSNETIFLLFYCCSIVLKLSVICDMMSDKISEILSRIESTKICSNKSHQNIHLITFAPPSISGFDTKWYFPYFAKNIFLLLARVFITNQSAKYLFYM